MSIQQLNLCKIDRTVKSSNIDYLSIDDYCGLSYNVNSMWTILHNLYEPQPQYPLLLETAIACYELITISSDYNFSLQTLCVLFSSLHKSPLTFQGLERQWVLFTDPRINIGSLSIEDSLIHILKVFQLMWLYTATLIRKINIKKD